MGYEQNAQSAAGNGGLEPRKFSDLVLAVVADASERTCEQAHVGVVLAHSGYELRIGHSARSSRTCGEVGG